MLGHTDIHPWASAHDDFKENVQPTLMRLGRHIGASAGQGDACAARIVELYTMLHRSFDPMTLALLKDQIKEWPPIRADLRDGERWQAVRRRHGMALMRLATNSTSYSSDTAPAKLDQWADEAVRATGEPVLSSEDGQRWRAVRKAHATDLMRLALGSAAHSIEMAPSILNAWADLRVAEVASFDPAAHLAESEARLAELEQRVAQAPRP